MNLLKVLMLVFLAASLSLLIPAISRANDHPWDDNTPDTTRLQEVSNTVKGDGAGSTLRPFIVTPIIHRISDWVRGILRDAHVVLFGQGKQETKGIVVERKTRPETPVVYRKHE